MERAAAEENFVPLRKKLRSKTTGKEYNFAISYYDEEGAAFAVPPNEVAQLRIDYNIEVEGEKVPAPVTKFSEVGLPSEILSKLQLLGCIDPTPIQMQSIPCAMHGRDIVACAETGSGKTLAYILPLFMLLHKLPFTNPGDGPLALILAPTRELTEQIYADILEFMPNEGIVSHTIDISETSLMLLRRKVLCVTGGTPSGPHIKALLQGIDIVVATPGRLLDLIDRAAMNMHRLTYLVFDEADKMLALEMEAQLRKILDFANICPRQTLLFSATFPETVERLIRSAVLNPIYIRVGQKKVGQAGLIPKTVTQSVLFMHSFQKKEQLLWVLRGIEYPPVLIFCNTHHTVDKVTALLKTEQFHVAALHSFKKQSYRSRIMKAFREGRLDILVGTDLASRGIDVSEISHVILYDMPDTIETYINRVGRTGRAGRPGQATLFLTLDCKIASELRQLLEANNQVVPKELENLRQFGHQVVQTEFGDRARK